ncbi:hypothetical protein KBD87_04505 [Candidatus Saccharibacteria bacterium]|nr:hypothetical protein [Candidatus Saccharibacteria bacterium]
MSVETRFLDPLSYSDVLALVESLSPTQAIVETFPLPEALTLFTVAEGKTEVLPIDFCKGDLATRYGQAALLLLSIADEDRLVDVNRNGSVEVRRVSDIIADSMK